MCGLSTESRGAGTWTPFAGASRVRTSAPATHQELKESAANEAGFGQKWPASFAKYHPDSSLWKTAQGSLLAGLDVFSETWPEWGMMHDGASYLLPTLVPRTSESEFGFLPTPDASLGKHASAVAADYVTCFRKAESGTRPSGAKIGSSIRWHQEFILEWQRTGGRLNAEWIEVLMGWPIGMTDLRPLETAKFQAWLRSHGESFRENEK